MHAVSTMHAHSLFIDNLAMTIPAVHGIQATAVSAVAANMAVEAFCRTVRRTLKEHHVDFMAVIAGMLDLDVGP